MKIILLSIAVLAAFVVIWFFFVVPAERRHHERKLEMVRKRIENRAVTGQEQAKSNDENSSDDEPRGTNS
jgi:hypothetical protein